MKKLAIIIAMFTSCTAVKQTQHHKTYCVVVTDVKYTKHNKANIKPKGTRYWFRYPTANVHIGDTVDISLNDRLEPKF